MLPRIFALFTVAGVLCLADADAAQIEKQEKAKELAEKFAKAVMMDMKVDDVMKQVAAPFYVLHPRSKEETQLNVYMKLDDVKKMFTRRVENFKGKGYKGKMSVKDNKTWDVFKADLQGEKTTKTLDDVLKKTDRVVEVKIALDGEKRVSLVTVLIAWRGDEPKVVGWAARLVISEGQ